MTESPFWPGYVTLRGGVYVEGLTGNDIRRLTQAGWIKKDGSFYFITSTGRENLP